MQIGMVGLGRMGGNMARRLARGGLQVVAWDRSSGPREALAAEPGVQVVDTPEALVAALAPPRATWLMLPAGAPTDGMLARLAAACAPGDLLVDGANAHYRDSQRHGAELGVRGLQFVDAGVSGGVWGLERGYCMMIGGDKVVVDRLDPIFAALAPGIGDIPRTSHREGRDPRVEQGYIHAGPTGSGHFVKMIHNGIEYGLMQAYAEGFDILKNANIDALPEQHRFDFDIADIAEVWRRGSVIPSWLLDLTASALAENGTLDNYSGHVEDSGEGRWTVNAAVDEAVPAEVLTAALFARFRSRKEHTFAEKILSAMRAGFGGHREPGKPDPKK